MVRTGPRLKFKSCVGSVFVFVFVFFNLIDYPEYKQQILVWVFFSFQVATDVIREFAADSVKYLELRSTPREEKRTGTDTQHGDNNLIVGFTVRIFF